MQLPQLKKMPDFHNVVSHPPDTPSLQTSNFHYQPYHSTHKGDKNITPEKLMEHVQQARAWLTAQAGSSPFGFIFEDGTYDLFPWNECLGLINNPNRFMREGPVAFFIGAGSKYETDPTSIKGVDWLINRSPYAKVFVTKDAKEACLKGPILNTESCVGITVAALRSFYTIRGGTAKNWAAWAELLGDENIAWPFCHYLSIVSDKVVTFSDHYSWSSTLGKNIGIDGIKRFATADYSMQSKVPMRDKPHRYEDFSHQWKAPSTSKKYKPFKPKLETKKVESVNSFNGKTYTQSYPNAVAGGDTLKDVAKTLLNYIGYPYA